MTNTFNQWNDIAKKDLDTVADAIVTNRKAHELKPDLALISQCGLKEENLRFLDFGCGVGRNSFGAAHYSSEWRVVGYDSATMIGRIPEFSATVGYTIPPNLTFTSDWESLKTRKFDIIYACIVFQHIYEVDLVNYLMDMHHMTRRVFVHSRRANDDEGKNTWDILQRAGLGVVRVIGKPFWEGTDPQEHNTCIFEFREDL